MTRRAWRLHLAVVLGYACAALVFTWPLASHLSTHLPGDPGGDTGVYVWNQWVFRHEIFTERRTPLTTEQIFSLTGGASLGPHNYTEFLNILALLLIEPLGVVATFNLVYLTVTVLTAWTTFLLARRVAGDAAVAWLAGLAFAFSPILVARSTGHVSLVAAAPLAAFLLCLLRADRSGRVRDAALTGLMVTWAALCDVYYAVFCVMMAGAYVAASVVRIRLAPRHATGHAARVLNVLLLAVGGLVAGLAMTGGGQVEVFGIGLSVRSLYTPVMVLTVLAAARIALELRPAVVTMPARLPSAARFALVSAFACALSLSPVLVEVGAEVIAGNRVAPAPHWRSSPRGLDLLALVSPNPNHPLVRAWLGDGLATAPTTFVEYTGSLSLVALATVGFAVWRAGFRPQPGWVALAAGFALLSLGPFLIVGGLNTHVPGPWAVLRYVPLIGAARTPTRFAVVAALALAVLFAVALVAIVNRWPARRRAIVAAASALLVFELWPAPRPVYSAAIPSLYDVIRDDPRPVRVLELPFGYRDGTYSAGDFSARSQFYQTRHGKRLIGGYLSRIPRGELEALRQARPTIDALLTLSGGGTLAPEQAAAVIARGPGFVARTNLGYVVIDYTRAPPALVHFARETFNLERLADEGPYSLYVPRAAAAHAP